MIDVIVNQCLLRLADRLLDGVQLLRQIETGATVGKHRDHLMQVTFGALQTLNDTRMSYVNVIVCHPKDVSP